MKKVDFIIVGQGIAGTTIAHSIEKKGASYIIVDNYSNKSSSFAAAGVFHPFSFKRLVLSWQANTFISKAISFYSNIEDKLNESLFSKHALFRVFSSIGEQNNWNSKKKLPTYARFIDETHKKKKFANGLLIPYGYGKVLKAGRLNVTKYILKSRAYFNSKNLISKEVFDYSKVKKKNNQIFYKGTTASTIIFCEGPMYINNPFFNYLPHNFCKGEIIIVESPDFPNKLVNKGCFVYPLGKHRFIVGSTYNHQNLDYKCTDDGKNELLKKVATLGDFEFKIIDQKAGVRPTTKDRRPLIGKHPTFENMYIFNGLGSKGVMLAPFLSAQLIDSILTGSTIDPEADISRYTQKHFNYN